MGYSLKKKDYKFHFETLSFGLEQLSIVLKHDTNKNSKEKAMQMPLSSRISSYAIITVTLHKSKQGIIN